MDPPIDETAHKGDCMNCLELTQKLREARAVANYLAHCFGRMLHTTAQTTLDEARRKAPDEIRILGSLKWDDR